MRKFILVFVLMLSACSGTDITNLYPTRVATQMAVVETTTPTPHPTVTPSLTEPPNFCTVTAAETLNLRAGPGTGYMVTHWLEAGEVLTLVDEPARGDWISVTTQSGAAGWIHSHYCEK